MCAAIYTDSDKSKTKPKQRIFGVFNRIKSAVTPKQPMLTTDAAPMDDSQIPSNAIQLRNKNLPSQQFSVPNHGGQIMPPFPMQLNHLNQLNQNATIIENQQNLSISNCDNVHIGANIFPERRSSRSSRSSSRKNSYNENRPKKMSKTIAEMMQCSDPIDVAIMRLASKYMDKDWRMVFRDLGITDPEINQITQQFINTTSVKEIIYQLLLIWDRNSDDPSLGKLISVLWENDHLTCVNELKMLYKQRKHQARKTSDTPAANTNGKNSPCNGESR